MEDPQIRALRLEGALTLSNADSLRASLSSALQEAAAITVDCSAATEVDITFLQLLLAARRTAAGSGKSVTVAAPLQGPLFETLCRAGFVDPSRAHDAADAAFWSAGSAWSR